MTHTVLMRARVHVHRHIMYAFAARAAHCGRAPRLSPGTHYGHTVTLDKWRSSGGKAGGNFLVDDSVPEVQRGLFRRKYGTIALSNGTPTELSYQAYEFSSGDVAGPVVYLVRDLQKALLRKAARATAAVRLCMTEPRAAILQKAYRISVSPGCNGRHCPPHEGRHNGFILCL